MEPTPRPAYAAALLSPPPEIVRLFFRFLLGRSLRET